MEVFGLILSAVIGAIVTITTAQSNRSSQMAAQREANKTNLQIAAETNQANKELSEQEFEQNKQMWQMENEYNLPANQMQRYVDAGLNPNLIYSQSNLSASAPKINYTRQNSTSVSPVFAPMDTSGISSLINSISQIVFRQKELQLQKEVADTNASKTKAEIDAINQSMEQQGQMFLEKIAQERIHTNSLGWDFEHNKVMYPIQQERARYDLKTAMHNFNRLEFQDSLEQLEYDIKKWQKDHMNEKWTYEKMLSDSQVRESYFRCWKILQEENRSNDLHSYQMLSAPYDLISKRVGAYNMFQYGQPTAPSLKGIPLAFPSERNWNDFDKELNSMIQQIYFNVRKRQRGAGRSF